MVLKQTEFDKLIAGRRFDDARDLLLNELASGRLLDPRSDPYWPKLADRVERAMRENEKGQDAITDFWVHLRDVFLNTIEPVWGPAHKGHIYFRLALATLSRNLEQGKEALKQSYQEDWRLEQAKGGTEDQVEKRSRQYSSYVVLAILERIEEADFSSQPDKEKFIARLFQSFNWVLAGAAIKTDIMNRAFQIIVPSEAREACHSIYEELEEVTRRKLPFATVSLRGTVLEAILFAELHYRRKIAKLTTTNRDIYKAELGALMNEADSLSVFPTDAIRVACQLVHIFRNRLHPGNEMRQTYKLVPSVALTIRNVFENAVSAWSMVYRVPNIEENAP
jgi:hypothetical protein